MSDLTARRYPDKYPAFITGSRELGSFKSGSDIDLVIFVDDPKVKASLKANSNHKGTPIYYGSLNLLICDTPEEYLFWRKALDLCKEKQSLLCRHLTKQERCEIHETLAEQLGIPFKNGKPTDYDEELF
jgi:hypothetical protein